MNEKDLFNILQRAMAPIRNRVVTMLLRALVTNADDTKPIQEVQVSSLNDSSRVQRFQQFGFTSNPPPGTEGIFLALGGNAENGVIVATENRDLRKKGLAVGEVAIYDAEGNYIHLMTGGKIKFKNTNEELVTVLSDLIASLIAAQTITMMGPQHFTPVTVQELTDIKTRLDTFKG